MQGHIISMYLIPDTQDKWRALCAELKMSQGKALAKLIDLAIFVLTSPDPNLAQARLNLYTHTDTRVSDNGAYDI